MLALGKKKNGDTTKIEPTLHATMCAKLNHDTHCMIIWMTFIVAEICSKTYHYFENVKSQLEALKLVIFLGDNVKEST
jgi:hypothetical protein